MTGQETSKISKKAGIMIAVLLTLVVLSITALAGRILYLNRFSSSSTTAVVPDNLIGEGAAPESGWEPESMEEVNRPDAAAFSEAQTPETEENSLIDAAGQQQTAAAIALYKGQPTDNEKFQAQNMFPGDTEMKYFAVQVRHHADVTLYFQAEITGQTKQIADVLHIKVTRQENGKVIYDGTFADLNPGGYGELLAADQSTETVAYYKIEVSLPTSVGNEYQAAQLTADFSWFVKDTGPLDSPKTGDHNRIILGAVIMCGSLAVLFLLFFIKHREKEREVAKYAQTL